MITNQIGPDDYDASDWSAGLTSDFSEYLRVVKAMVIHFFKNLLRKIINTYIIEIPQCLPLKKKTTKGLSIKP